ncbi:uncharacterized protein PG986_015187 [Apiospora aurea]|uniref:Uncharacterized protein n=1 Tax=Apiospora aurea TaxID=335848 RepID=A0ABR1PRV7_9PEZI
MVIRAPEAIPMTPTAGPDAADSAPTGNASTCLCPWTWITPRRCVVPCPARIGTRVSAVDSIATLSITTRRASTTPSRRQAEAHDGRRRDATKDAAATHSLPYCTTPFPCGTWLAYISLLCAAVVTGNFDEYPLWFL